MNAPSLAYQFAVVPDSVLAGLDVVRFVVDVETDEGEAVPAGTRGTVVAVWGPGNAYEVEVEGGLVTALPAQISMAGRRSCPHPASRPRRFPSTCLTLTTSRVDPRRNGLCREGIRSEHWSF